MKAFSSAALVLVAAMVVTESSSAATVLFGKTTDLGSNSSHSPDFLLGFRISVNQPVDLLGAGIIFRTSGYNANVGVYSSGPGGFPSQLLATTGVFNVSTIGIVETPFSSVITLTPGNYWFMADYDAVASVGFRAGTVTFPTDPNIPDVVAYRSLPFTSTLPSTFGPATLYTGQEFNYYLKTQTIPEPATLTMLLVAFAAVACRPKTGRSDGARRFL